MKLFFVIFVSALALSAADPQTQKKQAPQTPKAAAKAAPQAANAAVSVAIPADAVQGADGDYRYTDAQGKKWIYRKTPFGVTRLDDSPERAAAQAAAASGAGIKATEDGDKVRFERQGPFGVWKWEKKKSELDETEKAALENSRANNNTVSKQD
ncbi:MAG: hypothetical protein NTW28_12785 [Candidatus Solibacter sp.]|nr:hypothetical protein [Candidatus Solibacter sp.]